MKQFIAHLFLMGLVVALTACGQEKANHPTNNHDVQVKLIDVEQATVGRTVHIYGVISSGEAASLSFKSPGIIRRICAKEGDAVRKGTLLAELDVTEIEAQYTQAVEALHKQKRDHRRVEALYHDSIATQEQWQDSQTAVTMAEQSLKMAEFNRRNAAIYAPADGVVLWRSSGEGEYINPGQPIMQLSLHTDKDLVLKTGVSVADWLSLSAGDVAKCEIEGFPGEAFNGRVTRVAQAADLKSGLYQVEIALDVQRAQVVVGMFAKAVVSSSKQSTYQVLPNSCLHDGEGHCAFVYIAEGKQVKKIPVTVAFMQHGKAYISAGLECIGQVIHEGSGFLSPYSTISIQ